MESVGFIGLGRMGKSMAANLARKGFSLVVHDIIEAPVKALTELGAKPAASVAELAGQCSIIATMLPLAGRGGPVYLAAVLLAGCYMLYHVANLMKSPSTVLARKVVHASVLYLPVVLAMMMVYKA